MHKLDLYYDHKPLVGRIRRKHLHLEFAEKWDELLTSELEFIIGLSFQEEMTAEMKKTLLLQKLAKIPPGVFCDLDPVQVIQIYDCVDVFFESPELTFNPYPFVKHWNWFQCDKLVGPGDGFANMTVTEFIAAEDYYFDYLTEGYQESDLNQLIAVLWREQQKQLSMHDPEFKGDFRVPYNSHHVSARLSRVERLPMLKKMGMLFYYQGCRNLLIQLYDELFFSGGDQGEMNSEAWLEMLTHLPNDKFGTIDEIGHMNLLTVLYFTNLTISNNKKQRKSVV